MTKLSLGLDLSTQGLSASVLNIDNWGMIYETSLDYFEEDNVNKFGINEEYILPSKTKGQAEQPPIMFLESLEKLFDNLKDKVNFREISIINVSAQQHSHVYLGKSAKASFNRLKDGHLYSKSLTDILEGIFSYPNAPIWKTSNTDNQAREIRRSVGGKKEMIKLSGSNSPLRFTGAVIRKIGQDFPKQYSETETIQLLSNFIPAILTGNSRSPADFGSGCGTSLMQYFEKEWSKELINAASHDLPGGDLALRSKLPKIISPCSIVGEIADYFSQKYGFKKDCQIMVGSGDNLQSKVLAEGDLLSLGTSFVIMSSTDGQLLDFKGYANAMYDGLGRPFLFGCRTNGAGVWDLVRKEYGMEKQQYGLAEILLEKTPPGKYLFFWQPDKESFPICKSLGKKRINYSAQNLDCDYSGIIDSSLAAMYLYSKNFGGKNDKCLSVVGGPTNSNQIVRRISAIWNKPVRVLSSVGAAFGAAVAGVYTFQRLSPEKIESNDFIEISNAGKEISPIKEDVKSYHDENGYLAKFADFYGRIIS